MLRSLLVLPFAALLSSSLGCAPRALHSAAPPTARLATTETREPVEAADAAHALPAWTYAEATERATAMLLSTGVAHEYDWTEEHLAAARAAGLDVEQTLRLLEALAPPDDATALRAKAEEPAARTRLDLLFAYFPHVATSASLPRLYALVARHSASRAWSALDDALERTTSKALSACAPPSAASVAAMRTELASFVLVERKHAGLTVRIPNESERSDLAYLQAALADSGAAVGAWDEIASHPSSQTPPENQALDAIRATLDAAEKRGDARAAQVAARKYLGRLGYPQTLRGGEESRMTWGGPGYGDVMRRLARVDEVLGDFTEAAALYRQAPPGGGVCGTSVPYRLGEQRKGLIRAAERAGQCRTVVRERLYAIHESSFDYGPTRLRDAGWDVPRLYRAALLTIDRDAPIAELEQALDTLPSPLREAAHERLRDKGAEAFADSLRAAAGLADEAGSQALPILQKLAKSPSASARVQAVKALSELAELPSSDPCRPDQGTWFSLGGFGSGEPPREVRSLNHECKTKLTRAAQNDVVAVLTRAARDSSPEVRKAVAEGIVHVASTARARTVLERLVGDLHAEPGWTRANASGVQVPVLPVADAARTELEQLQERAKR